MYRLSGSCNVGVTGVSHLWISGSDCCAKPQKGSPCCKNQRGCSLDANAEREVVSTVRKRPSGYVHNVATARLLALLKGTKWKMGRLRQANAAGSLQKLALQVSTKWVTSGAHEKHNVNGGGQLRYTENNVLCFLCNKDCRNTSWLRVKRSLNDLGKLQEAANSGREREKMRTAVSAV